MIIYIIYNLLVRRKLAYNHDDNIIIPLIIWYANNSILLIYFRFPTLVGLPMIHIVPTYQMVSTLLPTAIETRAIMALKLQDVASL